MKYPRTIIASSLLPLLVAGCTVRNVSIVHPGPPVASTVGSGAVRDYAGFGDIKEDYQIQGMITADILPLMKNTTDARKALLHEGAVRAGANALVGFADLTEHYGGFGVSCAILANTGTPRYATQAGNARSKFIVGVLPVAIKTTKAIPAGDLQPRLISELRHQLAEKGYYTYPCRGPAAESQVPALDQIAPGDLKEPLGVEPDFALICEITEGKHLGTQALFMRAALYDLKERKTLWEWKEDETLEPPVMQWGMLEQATSPDKKWFRNEGQLSQAVQDAVKKGAKKLPAATGHQKLKM